MRCTGRARCSAWRGGIDARRGRINARSRCCRTALSIDVCVTSRACIKIWPQRGANRSVLTTQSGQLQVARLAGAGNLQRKRTRGLRQQLREGI